MDAALADALHHVGAHPLFHADLDAAVGRFLQKRRHVIGQRFGHDRGRDQHAHMAPGAGGIRGHVAFNLPHAGQHGAGVLQQCFARRSGHHAPALAQQQGRALGVFQLGQPLADGRAHDGLLLGHPRNAALVAHGGKQAQGLQIKIAHGL